MESLPQKRAKRHGKRKKGRSTMKAYEEIDAEDAAEMFENVKQLLFEETHIHMAGLTAE